jgi:hypothetical protein
MLAQHALEPVVRDAAGEMVNMVHTDVGSEPAQDVWQVVDGVAAAPDIVGQRQYANRTANPIVYDAGRRCSDRASATADSHRSNPYGA